VSRYTVTLLYDSEKVHNSGSTIPIRIQVSDGSRASVSFLSASLNVHAVGVRPVSATAKTAMLAMSEDFKVVGMPTSYMLNVKTTGFAKGSYELVFTIGSQSTLYTAPFQLR
jgi:hypothetical protein